MSKAMRPGMTSGGTTKLIQDTTTKRPLMNHVGIIQLVAFIDLLGPLNFNLSRVVYDRMSGFGRSRTSCGRMSFYLRPNVGIQVLY